MIKVGIIGCGNWGSNYVRIFSQLPAAQAFMAADPDECRLKTLKNLYPSLKTATDYRQILDNPEIDAVTIATPTDTHYAVAKLALERGKHVLCEKPLAMRAAECRDLQNLAESNKKVLMVGHIFVFNAGIMWLKEYIRSGQLGRIYYAYASRTNLGPFRYDVNALWDLSPHDIAIFNYLFDQRPVNVSARGQRYLGTAMEDVGFASLEYPQNVTAHIHVSWLDPRKVRQITVVGDKQMALWDDLDGLGPVRVYDKHVEKTSTFYATYGEFQLLSREGSITIPKISSHEPLKRQAQYFLDCIASGRPPELADARKGLDVVMTLEAIARSLEEKGRSVALPASLLEKPA